MFAFWDALLAPLMEELQPRRIIEIGSDQGTTTRALAGWADAHQAILEVIDPEPEVDVQQLREQYPQSLIFHGMPSLDVLPDLKPADLVLIDGDHNRYTVLNELRLLDRAAQTAGESPPVVALHDIGWPYGRRDLYYVPDRIPEGERRPFERRGLSPDSDELVDEGLNPHLANAKLPAPQHSGVLGAVEDFIAESERDWRWFEVPGQHGLGVLAAAGVLGDRESVAALLEATGGPEFLRLRLEAVERERLQAEIRRSAGQRKAQAALDRAAEAQESLVGEFDREREGLEQTITELRREAESRRLAAADLREAGEESGLRVRGLQSELLALKAALGQAEAAVEVARAERGALERRLHELAELHETTAAELERTRASPPAMQVRAPIASTAAPAEAERAAAEEFASIYPGTEDSGVDLLALPSALDRRRVLVPAGRRPEDGMPSVDVVICVHDALEDVRRCLWSLLERGSYPLHLILVNDGSEPDTTAFLADAAALNPALTLIHNDSPPHGYTIAANLGLSASDADYVVLLNSDTVVTAGWLERLVECGESDERIGILGPLSNAASHQSVPKLRDGNEWATNPMPGFTTEEGVAALLDHVSPRTRPRLPFINGFCYVIKRRVLDAIGSFDAENFASGYCEENDFSYRASRAGFDLAVADDCYVFHAKSRSYTAEVRKPIAKRNYEIFLRKHDAEEIKELVAQLESDTSLEPIRRGMAEGLTSGDALADALFRGDRPPLRVSFVLPGMGAGGSGGSHSIYQEARGLKRLGVPARILLVEKAWDRALATYPDATEVFEPFADQDDLAEKTADADVIAATHFKSVGLVAELRERRDDFVPAYYVQDYEPFFASREDAGLGEALASYTAIPDCVLFAKTHWLCNIVGDRHGVPVAKVEPSLDSDLFRPRRRDAEGPLRVAAMVRPRTPRRQPVATCVVLEALRRHLGDDVEIATFGCSASELAPLPGGGGLADGHRGLLKREEVATLLQETDVFLDLSLYQAFGRTALEAMACGAVAVVPRLGGVWEFADPANAYAVDTTGPEPALEALSRLAGDREMLHRMQEAALRTASRYSTDRAALSEYLLFSREYARRFGSERAAV